MSIVEKRVLASATALFLLGAVLIPCVLYAQTSMGEMNMAMPMGGMQKQCCAIYHAPDFHHAVLQSATMHEAYRGTLLLVILFAVVVLARVVRARTENPGNFSTIREFTLRQAKIPPSGFERFLKRGIAQLRLYEPAIV